MNVVLQRWTCPACGARNQPAEESRCSGCGARRPAGAMVEEAPPSPPPAAPPPPARPRRPPGARVLLLAAGGGVACGVAAVRLALALLAPDPPAETETGYVTGKHWAHEVPVEWVDSVVEEDWSVPDHGRLVQTIPAVRSYRHVPVRRRGRLVDFRNEPVTAPRHRYRVERWGVAAVLRREGTLEPPSWPVATLAPGQREGIRRGRYELSVSTPGGREHTISVPPEEFARWRLGDRIPVKARPLGVAEIAPDTGGAR